MTPSAMVTFVVPMAGYLYCLIFSLMYLLMDLSQDFNDFPPAKAFLGNAFFWLYWLLQFLASSLAFYLLKTNLLASWKQVDVLVALIAVFGSSLVLQNQLVRVAGKPVVDLSGVQKGLRRQLIVQIGKISGRVRSNRILRIAEKLAAKYKDRETELEGILRQVMLAGGVEENQVTSSIQRIKERSLRLGVSPAAELARVLAQTDIDQAERHAYRQD